MCIQPSSARKTFSNWALNKKVKNLIKTYRISKTVRDTAKLIINQYYEVLYALMIMIMSNSVNLQRS